MVPGYGSCRIELRRGSAGSLRPGVSLRGYGMSTENKNTIQPWHLPERPRVLMIGNGFNRTFNMKSWKNLIDSVRTRKDLDDGLLGRIPLTMQVVLATDDKVYDSMKEVAEYMRNFHLTPEHTALLEKITEIPTETILTSNYSYELEKVLTGRCGYWARNPYRRYAVPYYSNNAVRFLHRYSHVPAAKGREALPGDPGYRNIWHIHGEVDQPRHIIMGHYFYGKMEYEIQTYLPYLERRVEGARKAGGIFYPRSWVDYYLIGDLYIAGFGQDFSESDIWYLACTKKRHFPAAKTYYYTPVSPSGRKDLRDEEKAMLEAYGIEVRERPIADDSPDRYVRYYKNVIAELRDIFRE